MRRIPELHGLWPEAKFVHLVRDGRDVCLSMMNWRERAAAGRYTAWEVDPVSITALWWRRKVLLGREGGGPLGPGLYHEVRYESLISDPARECERLCGFLGVPCDDAMTQFDERRKRTDPDLDESTRPCRSRWPRDWHSQMPRGGIERFEAAAGDLLKELGYPLATDPKPEAMRHAAEDPPLLRAKSSRGEKLAGGLGSVNPYVFIVGCARSGRRCCGRLVDAHPLIAIIHETHWITKRFNKR